MADARARQPKGIPVGGEFAANAHDEAGGSLSTNDMNVEDIVDRIRERRGDYFGDLDHLEELAAANKGSEEASDLADQVRDQRGDYLAALETLGDLAQSEGDAERNGITDISAGAVRAGDVVFFSTFRNGRDVDEPHTVTRVERLIGLDRREQVRLSFDGVPAESLGEGAGVYWSTASLRITPAPREAGRTPREITAEIKAGQRKLEYLEPGDEFSQEEQDTMVSAALDPGVDGMSAARAKRAADVAEAHNFHMLAIRLRAAAERHRLSEDPMSRMNDPYSIAASPDTPADLVIRATQESPSDAVTRNPNAPAEALDILARYEKVQTKHNMGWLRDQIAAHPNTPDATRVEIDRINARLLLGN